MSKEPDQLAAELLDLTLRIHAQMLRTGQHARARDVRGVFLAAVVPGKVGGFWVTASKLDAKTKDLQ